MAATEEILEGGFMRLRIKGFKTQWSEAKL